MFRGARSLVSVAVAVGAVVLVLPLGSVAIPEAVGISLTRALLSLAGVAGALLLGLSVREEGQGWRVALVVSYLLATLGEAWDVGPAAGSAPPLPHWAHSDSLGRWLECLSLPALALAAWRAGGPRLGSPWGHPLALGLPLVLVAALAFFGPVPTPGSLRWCAAAGVAVALAAAVAASRPGRTDSPALDACFRLAAIGLGLQLALMAAAALAPEHRLDAVLRGRSAGFASMVAHAMVAGAPLYGVLVTLRQTGDRVADLRASLRESERRYARLLLAMPDLLFDLDAGGIVRFANPRWRDVLGLEPEAVVGTPLLRWIAPEDHGTVELALETCRRGDPQGAECEVRAGPGPAGWRTLHTALCPVRDEARLTASILGVCRDITDRRAMEQELAQAQRLERVGTLAAGIAHDFNNILGTIVISTGSIRALRNAPSDVRQAVADITEAAERGADLARSLMALGRSPSPEASGWTPLGSSVERVMRVLVPNLGDRLRLRLDVPADPPDVVGQPAELEQVLMNLLLNARDALPDGGEILLAARAEEGFGVIEVSDNGIGIPPDVLPRIFEPYMSTKGAGRGTGLGLAIVRRLVEDLGGKVAVRSRAGEGTTFTVRLPTRDALRPARGALRPARSAPLPDPALTTESLDPEDIARADAEASAPTGEQGAPRILVVDDEALMRRATARALTAGGFDVVTAGTMDEALAAFGDGPFDVVILDLALSEDAEPAANLAALRRRSPGVAVVVSSGNHARSEVDRLLAAGAASFLPKPAAVEDMMAAVWAAMRPPPSLQGPPEGGPTE